MKRKLRLYLPFVGAGMQETATYRVNWIFFLFGEALACAVSFFIWNAVYNSGGGGEMHGFTFEQMIVYIVLMFLTNGIIGSDASWSVGEEVRDGSIAMRMIKPVSYNATFLFQEIGNKILTELVLLVPLVIVVELIRWGLSGVFSFSAAHFLLYLLSCALAYLINFFFNICFGFIAFVIKYLWGANMMKNCIVGFLSGAIIPLSFLPEGIRTVFLLLPFASLNYTPVMIYMGKYTGLEMLWYMGLQLFWVFAFWALSKLLWKLSVKRLCVQGG